VGVAHLLIMMAQLWRSWVCEGLQVCAYPPERDPHAQEGVRLLDLSAFSAITWGVRPYG
jgi:hypothetical protein